MRVNFFMEFAEEELKYVEEIDFPSTLVIAAESLDDFEQYSSRLQEINPELEAAYWPSPFSDLSELERIEQEIENTNSKVFLDVEPPILDKKRFLKG